MAAGEPPAHHELEGLLCRPDLVTLNGSSDSSASPSRVERRDDEDGVIGAGLSEPSYSDARTSRALGPKDDVDGVFGLGVFNAVDDADGVLRLDAGVLALLLATTGVLATGVLVFAGWRSL